VGGEYDIFMSTDEHFRLAGERAVRHALEQAGSRLLEPWSNIELEAPPQQVGEVLGELAAHRGQVHGVDVDGASARIVAEVPDRELRTFAARLQALTSGRGRFAAAHSRYGLLPTSLQAEAVAESPFRARARGAR
jgi:elongation factor G